MQRPRRSARSVNLSPGELDQLYSARRFIGGSVEEKLGFRKQVDAYLQDPRVAALDPELAFDDECDVDIEPGLSDGPTSARFAVVDYNADTESLAPFARWDATLRCFVDSEGEPITREHAGSLAFDQVAVWGLVQRALRFFEEPQGLGRPLPWGFAGNRLIVVPHAGYGENAYYDRQSKSLQFYYFDRGDQRIYTCRSADIVHHEFGHAVLDGVRPRFIESSSVETAAFHESIGDLTAILLLLRNNAYRGHLARVTRGNLSEAENLFKIAEQFGEEVQGRPYLRSARSGQTMHDVAGSRSGHEVSEVLTATMFEIMLDLSTIYLEKRQRTAAEAFWYTIARMQRRIIQPLDFLPPVDVTFRDYALAVLRVESLTNPRDPYGYCAAMIRVFVRRGILSEDDAAQLSKPDYLLDRGDWDYFHDVPRIGSSKAAAYRFLDDNRRKLGIPPQRDVEVADLYTAEKYGRQNRRLPRQTVLEYVWYEDLALTSIDFGPLRGRSASFPCGGTLVFDDTGLLWHVAKPGPGTEAGERRGARHLDDIRHSLRRGLVGTVPEGAGGMLGAHMPPLTVEDDGASVSFRLSPHLNLSDDHDEGGQPWELSF